MPSAAPELRRNPRRASVKPKETISQNQLGALHFRGENDGGGADRSACRVHLNLDQPYWALLTVFIVSQPLQSGQVLAKSLYRIIGTVIGAGVALLFVALFAQERVLFLGALALWILRVRLAIREKLCRLQLCPVRLHGGNRRHSGRARRGQRLLHRHGASDRSLPGHYRGSDGQPERRRDSAPSRAKLLGQAVTIENLRASAIFEDREIRDRSDQLRFLDTALVDAIGVAQPLGQQLDTLERRASNETGLDDAIADATAAIRAWRSTAMGADALSRGLLRVQAHLPLVWPLCRDPSMPDEE